MSRKYTKQHVRAALDGFIRWKIRKHDEVQVTAGREAGKVGTVKKVIHDKVRPLVILDGINLQRRPKPAVRDSQS